MVKLSKRGYEEAQPAPVKKNHEDTASPTMCDVGGGVKHTFRTHIPFLMKS